MNKYPRKLRAKSRLTTTVQSKHAEFIGWQKTAEGEIFAIYNITNQKHPRYGSTVSKETLRELKLKVPETPPKPFSYPLFKLPEK